MKKHPSLSKFVFLFLIAALVFTTQCKQKPQEQKAPPKIDQAFTGYVSAYTYGVISNASVVRIKLMDNYHDAKINEPLDLKLFSFSPKIKGTAYFVDKRTIEFQPEERLPSGQIYDAKFYLSELHEVPKKLETMEFQFQTMRQSLSVIYDGLKAYDPKDLSGAENYGAPLLQQMRADETNY